MQNIEIQTTQNVNIEYTVASIGDRVIGAIIDNLIVAGYFIASIFLIILLRDSLFISDYSWAIFIILYLPAFFYNFLCETFLNGQTFGKKIIKTKVVKLDGSQASVGSYFLRWLISPIDIYFTYGSVGLITMLINGKGQRLGDLAANTTVIKLKSEVKLEDTILRATPTNYEIRFPQVNQLNDSDISIVKEVLDLNFKNPDAMVYDKIITKAKQTIEKKLGVNSDMHPLAFLDTVLKDYNYLNGE
jgi:uncharacterized RDD family membrane protein YckC